MKRILPVSDISSIRAILGRDGIYDILAYDGSPSLQDYVPSGVWLALFESDDIAGIINLDQLNNVMWQAHIFIFSQFRGNGSEQWGIQAAQYMAEHGAKKILAITPYESAKRYAERMGMKNTCILTNSIRKNGQLLDQWLLEKTL